MPAGVGWGEQQGQKARKEQKQQMAATNVSRAGKDEKKGHVSIPYGEESRVLSP